MTLTFVRRFIALVSTIITLLIFIPIGIALWIVVIARAILVFVSRMVVDALTNASAIDPSSLAAVNDSIGFFPNGILSIVANFQAMWNGTFDASRQSPPRQTNWDVLWPNVIIAVIFWGIVGFLLFPPDLNYMPKIMQDSKNWYRP